MIETEETSLVDLATSASVVGGGVLGGRAVIGTPVGDTGGTSVKCSVDKVGALIAGLAEDDIAKVWSNRRLRISTLRLAQPAVRIRYL